MMHQANIPTGLRYKLWREAVKTATLLDGLVVVEYKGEKKSRYEHIFKETPNFAKNGKLKTWGEAGTVTIKTKVFPKLEDRGVHCLFVGYALDHPNDTYRMYDPKTRGVRVTRDITWLRRMFYQRRQEDEELEVEDDLVMESPQIEIIEDDDDVPEINEGVGGMEEGEGDVEEDEDIPDLVPAPAVEEDDDPDGGGDDEEDNEVPPLTNRYG